MSASGQEVARRAHVAGVTGRAAASAQGGLAQLRWAQWQDAVVRVLRAELGGCLPAIGCTDVDWDAWRQFYEAGRTPVQAVNRALEKDL